MTSTLVTSAAFTICMIISAGDGGVSHQTIDVPTNYPPNWLENGAHPSPFATATMQRNDDGTIDLKNATLTFSFNGSVLKPFDVVAFADLGSRSVMLKAKKDSQAYRTLANNMTIKHGDSRLQRFDVVGEWHYCAPVANGQIDLLNPVAVLHVKSVRFYLVPAGTP